MAPDGMTISPRSFGASTASSLNRIVGDPDQAYDEAGRMTRVRVGDHKAAATWTPTGRLATFYYGQPGNGSHSVSERYVYDSSGARLIRYPDSDLPGGDGRPVISIRNLSGEVLSEYVVDPSTGEPRLVKDFVYAGGLVIAERRVASMAPAIRAGLPLYRAETQSYYVDLVAGLGFPSYSIDIRTASGYFNRIDGVVPASGFRFTIPESAFALGAVNYIRVRPTTQVPAVWSAPMTLMIDPNVTPQSLNQTRAVAVSRVGTDIRVSFALASPNGKTSNIWFVRADTGLAVKQNLSPLPPGTATLTLGEQSFPVLCGVMVTEQDNVLSTGADVPAYSIAQNVEAAGADCETEPGPSEWIFEDRFHHRDHLGSLRVVTDAAGWSRETHDYYPFGMAMEPFEPPDNLMQSRMRYTVHERDAITALDYMMARYKLAASAQFLSPDPGFDSSLGQPSSWNQYAYTRNDPLNYSDPAGMRAHPAMCGIFNRACNGGGGLSDWGVIPFPYDLWNDGGGGGGGYGPAGILEVDQPSITGIWGQYYPTPGYSGWSWSIGGGPFDDDGLPWLGNTTGWGSVVGTDLDLYLDQLLGRYYRPPEAALGCLERIFGSPARGVVVFEQTGFLARRYPAMTAPGVIFTSYRGDDFFRYADTVVEEYWHVLRQWNNGRMNIISYATGVAMGQLLLGDSHDGNPWEIEAMSQQGKVKEYRRCYLGH